MKQEERLVLEEKVREKVPVIVKRREIVIEENKPERQADKSSTIPRRWHVQ